MHAPRIGRVSCAQSCSFFSFATSAAGSICTFCRPTTIQNKWRPAGIRASPGDLRRPSFSSLITFATAAAAVACWGLSSRFLRRKSFFAPGHGHEWANHNFGFRCPEARQRSHDSFIRQQEDLARVIVTAENWAQAERPGVLNQARPYDRDRNRGQLGCVWGRSID